MQQAMYTLRQMRLPTAASAENPLPAPSTSKSRRFISNNIGHAIRRTAGGTLSPELAKKLAQLIAMEKNLLRSMENVSKERMDGAQQLSSWGEDQDEDVSDVTDKLSVLLYEVGDLEDQYVDRYDQYRIALKDVRNIEKVVQPIRDRKQKVADQIAQLKSRTDDKNPDKTALELESLEQELVRVEAESIVAEAQLSNITHEKVKSAFNYQFDAMREYGEKLAIIAGYGKHLMDLIDENPVSPGENRAAYKSHEASAAIISDCDHALTTWMGSNAAVTSKISSHAQSLKDASEASKETAGDSGTHLQKIDESPAETVERPAAASRRRWSSDSEGAADAPVEKPVLA